VDELPCYRWNYRPSSPEATETISKTGPMEASALRLAAAGREVDAALAEYAQLKPRITAALQGWRHALEQLPTATNGHAPHIGDVAT
jgi:hypothetical protein